MTADSKYVFKRTTGLATSYILQSHEGVDIPDFPPTYKRTPKNKLGSYPELKGRQYVNFRSTCNALNPLQKEKFEYCLSLVNGSNPVGFNFPHGTMRAASDNRSFPHRNDAVLLERSEDWNTLTIFFFFGAGNKASDLLKRWNCGQEIEVC